MQLEEYIWMGKLANNQIKNGSNSNKKEWMSRILKEITE